MWSYYGTKKALAKHYPTPIQDTIIEPFCGAAQYSLFGDNWKKNIILYDKYNIIYEIWNYLINYASSDNIKKLPLIQPGTKISGYDLDLPLRYLIGFCINSGSAQPKQSPAKYNSWERQRIFIADNLYKIKHWKIYLEDYKNIPNKNATWYIDPPYQYGGEWYHSSVSNKHINYTELSRFCTTRMGQVIVCENSKANWLPFTRLCKLNGQKHSTTEVIWTNSNIQKIISEANTELKKG